MTHAAKLALSMTLGSSLLLGCSLMGCGGVETPGSGGAGANDDGTGAGHPSGSGATMSGNAGSGSSKPSASSGPGGDPCDAFCASVGACYDDCHATCKALQDPPCSAEGAAAVDCLIGHYDSTTCTPEPMVCDDALGALNSCEESQPLDCGASECGGNQNGCACTAQCTGGERKLTCNYANGMSTCTCYVNGFPVIICGSTPDPDPVQTCQIDEGSCCGLF